MIFEIFTDGSSSSGKGKGIKCSSSAFKIYLRDRPVKSGGKFFENGTNNLGESAAVLLGLETLEKLIRKANGKEEILEPPYKVMIYSDSLITCEACRSWIYNWVRNSNDSGDLLKSSGEVVFNQNIFKDIYKKYLINNDFDITFLHLKSHAIETVLYTRNIDMLIEYFRKRHTNDLEPLSNEFFNEKKFIKARESFMEKNKMEIRDIDLLRLLLYNREVDDLAVKQLQKGIKNMKNKVS